MEQKINDLNRIKCIIRSSVWVTVIGVVVFLFYPGWQFSAGVLVGGCVSVFDFWMIVTTMSKFKLSLEDSRLMLKFGLLFVAKSFILLFVLACIILVFKILGAKMTTIGFVCGLAVVPMSIVITGLRRGKKE